MDKIYNIFERKEIILTRGIPASGKSTWAELEIKTKEGGFLISKDQIRKEMGMTRDSWSKTTEKIVVETERKAVAEAMKYKTNKIIVDNTHLGVDNPHIKFYKELAEANGYKFTIKDFYVGRDEAIRRDKLRDIDKQVGADVIDKMIAMQGNGGYPKNPEFKTSLSSKKENAYIVDIDGTLAFMDEKRNPYDFSKVAGDRCNVFLREIIDTLFVNGNNIIIVSGRGEECRAETESWLRDNDILYNSLLMRKEKDNRKDAVVKREIYETIIEPEYNVIGVFDDRQQVVDMWRLELGLPTYQVWYGNF